MPAQYNLAHYEQIWSVPQVCDITTKYAELIAIGTFTSESNSGTVYFINQKC